MENATPADTHWAIIIPPLNEALADPSLPLYSALSLSLPLLSLPLSPIPLSLTHNNGSLFRPFTSPLCLLAWDPNFIPRYHIWATHLSSSQNSSKLHQIISWLPAQEITILNPRPPIPLLSVFFAPVLSLSETINVQRPDLMHFSIYRNNRFARYPAVTTLTRPALRGLILGPSTGDYQCRLHLMAIDPLLHRPLLLVTHTRPQSQ